ncbi:MAG TPA: YihY/virulence factor BrkB family protein [Tepidiformaceae bacterium]|nr:YihY/virulence factor BrkB family protein [Tepidiformaceae bacterium]
MALRGVHIKETAKGVIRESLADDVTGMAAELSYRFFLAVFPFAIMIAALSGFAADALNVENPAQRIVDQFSEQLPQDTTAVLQRQMDAVFSSRNVSLLSIGLIGAVWASAGGISALIKALDRAYDVPETRPWWRKTVLSVGLTMTAGLFVVAAFLAVVTIGVWGKDIADSLGAAGVYDWVVRIGRWVVPVLLVMVAVAILYWAAPNIDQKFRFVSPGSVLFTVAWAVGTWAFSLYVGNFGSYNATYGALGGVVVLLLWFYLTSIMLLVGAELNALIDVQLDPAAVRDRREKVLRQRREERPTAIEEMEQRNHGLEQPGAAGEERRGGMSAGPLVAVLGVFAAMFAIRRLVR